MRHGQGEEIGGPEEPLVAGRIIDVQKDYGWVSRSEGRHIAAGLTCVPSHVSLPDLLSDNQFPVFLRLSTGLRLVDVIVRAFNGVFVSLELFEQFAILFQCPLEGALAGDPTIVPERNNKVSNGFDKRNVVGLQETINFESKGIISWVFAYHEDDCTPANQVAFETLFNDPATGVDIECCEDLYIVRPTVSVL